MHKLIPFFILFLSSYTVTLAQDYSYKLTHFYTDEDGLSSNHITCLKRYDISLLVIGTKNGIQIYDGYNFQLLNSSTPPPFTINADTINAMAIGNDGHFWIGSTNGINKIGPTRGTNHLYLNKGNLKYPPLKSANNSNTLIERTPNGTIWVVNNDIICQIENEKIKQYFPVKFNRIKKIISDKNNNLFALTDKALICLNPSGELLFKIKGFSSSLFSLQQMGKMSNLFKTKKGEIIIEDELNDRYYKIDASKKIEDITAENHWLPNLFKEVDRHINVRNIKTFRKFDFLETENGLIWVATNLGLAKLKIEGFDFQKEKKSITHFVPSYKKYNSSNGKLISFFINPNKVEPITLSPHESYLELQFINSDYTSPLKNTFSHYLEGYENDWFPYSNRHSIVYSNLPAGEYTFLLKSKNADGLESDFVFKIPIIVKQSFYKSGWFIALIGTVFLLSFIFFNRLKINQERKITRLRNRMARDLHDEVSNSLNNIRIIAKETNYSDQEAMKSDFHRIQKMSSNAIQHVEDVIWSIDTKYSKAENLFFKMEDYVDDNLRAKNIPVQFIREGLNNDALLGFAYRRNMLLIFKEAISNIVKHTKPLQVEILYKKTRNKYIMRIRNTFEEQIESENSTGKGLIGMKQRAESMGATLKIIKEKNQFELLMEKRFK